MSVLLRIPALRFRPRLRLRSLVILVALLACLLGVGMRFLSPTRRLGRLLGPDQPAYVRRDAVGGLGQGIPAWEEDEAIRLLIGALEDPNPMVRLQAAAALHEHGRNAEPAVPKLIALLSGPDRMARYTAALALGRAVGADSPRRAEVVTALTAALSDPDTLNRLAASEALIGLGEASEAGATVASALADPDEYVRSGAHQVLRRTRVAAEFAIPWLVPELRNPDARRRAYAFGILTEIAGPQEVRAALAEAARSDDASVSDWAGGKLKALDASP